MNKIYFVRHAHSIYTPDELNRPLSIKGLKDAEKVTDFLKEEDIDLVYSSPYKRAIQTIQGVADYLDVPIQIEDNFRERLLSDYPVEDFNEAITKVWQDYDYSFQGGESNNVAQRRGIISLLKVMQEHPDKNIVIGTHGNIMVLMMNYYNSKYGFEFWKQLEMPDIYVLTFDNSRLIDVNRIWI
ncbi:histidine phosphatase family protein [Ornithinibacillus californiensis]|uniref:histidine phosphatase family protein n=1 Tax=Ornithinibacillus californiensis TaxID=161536 RepID=UPI00064D853E|nr:histidine phosphatase family protein [Ornithinibacillus californiensis]